MVRSPEEKQAFVARAAEWEEANLAPVGVAFKTWGSEKARGVKPVARRVLKDGTADCQEAARMVLRAVVTACIQDHGFTHVAQEAGYAAAKVTETELADRREAIAAGVILLDLAATATGAFCISQILADRPEIVDGGAKLTTGYELEVTDGDFLADAVAFGAVGMPTYSKDGVRDWQGQDHGGAKGQTGGMVHRAGDRMEGVTAETAPRLFAAANAAQAVRFKVNPVSAALVDDYDETKAYAWLFAHFVGKGLGPEDARRKAKEAARL